MDLLALFVILVSLYYLIRRAFWAKMRFPPIFRDYLAIILTAAPFVTGFMAFHQLYDYRTVIICHMLSGQLMLLALPYTKLGHLIFFFFGRLFLHGELNLWGGSRAWKRDQDLEDMVDTIWNKCVLCERCYCPIGLKIPEMISLARSICRSQGVYKTYDG